MKYLSVKDPPYNAVGNGIANDTPAIQAAMSAAISGQMTLLFPGGSYRIVAAITVCGEVNVEGQGRGESVILLDGAAIDGFDVQSQGAFVLRDLRIEHPATPTGGAMVKLCGPSSP